MSVSCDCFLNMYKTQSFSVVVAGGINVDMLLFLKLFVKRTHSSRRRFVS